MRSADKVNVAARNVEKSEVLRDMIQATVDAKKAMVAALQRDIAELEPNVAKMDDAAKHDRDKLRRLEAGEDVPVRELTSAEMRAIFKAAGWTRSKFYRAERMQALDEAGFEEYLAEVRRLTDDNRRETRALNRVIDRRRRAADLR